MNGFTLLDTLLTLALLTIIALIGMGSLNQSLSRYEAHTFIDQLVRDLEFARQQALLMQGTTQVCPTKNGLDCGLSEDWQWGYVILTKENRIHRHFERPKTLENSREYIEFSPQGFSENTNSTFTYTTPYQQKKVIINRQGRIRVEQI